MKHDQDFQDDFQFKPLTEGLGFHPKKVQTDYKPEVKTSTKTELKIENRIEPKRSNLLDTPLPRPRIEVPKVSPSSQAVDGLLKSLQEKNKTLKFEEKSKTIQSPYVHAAPSLTAGFLDFLLIISLSLFYMIAMTFSLKMDLIRIIADGSLDVLITTGALFACVGVTYFLAMRMFLGFTLGEWAYEQRLGLPEEFKSGYSLKVLLRIVLHLATGIIVIPLLSWALDRDLASLSGLSTYRQR